MGGGNWNLLSDIYSLLTIGHLIVFVGTKRDAGDNMHQTLTKEGGGVRCYMVKWNTKIVMLPWKHCETERVMY